MDLSGLGYVAQGILGGYGAGQGFDQNDAKLRLLGLQEKGASLENLKHLLGLVESSPSAYDLYKDQVPQEQQGFLQNAASAATKRQNISNKLLSGYLSGQAPSLDPKDLEGVNLGSDPTIQKHLNEMLKTARTTAQANTLADVNQGFRAHLTNLQLQNNGAPIDERNEFLNFITTLPKDKQRDIMSAGGEKGGVLHMLDIKGFTPTEKAQSDARQKIRAALTGDLPDSYEGLLKVISPYMHDAGYTLPVLQDLFPQRRAELKGLEAYMAAQGKAFGENAAENAPVGSVPTLPGRYTPAGQAGQTNAQTPQLQLGQSPLGQQYGFSQAPQPQQPLAPQRTIFQDRLEKTGLDAVAKETPTLRNLRGAQTKQAEAIARNLDNQDKPAQAKVGALKMLREFVNTGKVMEAESGQVLQIHNDADVNKMAIIAKGAGINLSDSDIRKLKQIQKSYSVQVEKAPDGVTPQMAHEKAKELLKKYYEKRLFNGLDDSGRPAYLQPDMNTLKKMINDIMAENGWARGR